MSAKLFSIDGAKRGSSGNEDEPTIQQSCGECNWPHFKLHVTESGKIATECTGCGGLAVFGILIDRLPVEVVDGLRRQPFTEA